jgi:hypothetical protein
MTCADVLGLGGGRGERRRLPPEAWATKLSKRESRAPPVQLCQQAAGQTRWCQMDFRETPPDMCCLLETTKDAHGEPLIGVLRAR